MYGHGNEVMNGRDLIVQINSRDGWRGLMEDGR